MCETLKHTETPQIFAYKLRWHKKSGALVIMGNTFLELPRLRETTDNTERYI
jgi:hypothetical protein